MIIFDLNSKFCKIYLPSPEHQRTRDQMFQAARSSKQCVVEGYTQESLKGYIYLTGIAHGSNEELREDYIDFLRQRELTKWPKDHPKLGIKSWVSRACRDIAEGNIPTYPTIPTDPEYAANVILDLSIKAGYMLKRLVESLKERQKNFTKREKTFADTNLMLISTSLSANQVMYQCINTLVHSNLINL